MVTSSILRDERSWFCRPGHSSSLWHGGVKRFANGAPCMFRRGVFPGFLCGTSVVRVVPRLFLAVVWRFQSKYGTTYYHHRVLMGFSLSQLFSVFNRSMERLTTISGSSKVILCHNGSNILAAARFIYSGRYLLPCSRIPCIGKSVRGCVFGERLQGDDNRVRTWPFLYGLPRFLLVASNLVWRQYSHFRRETYTTLFIVRRVIKCTLSVSFFRTTTTIQGYTGGVCGQEIQSLSAAPAYGNEQHVLQVI